MGDGVKRVLEGEAKFRPVFHKSIVADMTIKEGTKITKEMLTVKRPGGGLYPKDMPKIIGRKASRDIKKDELIKLEDLK
jgi:sialic acid synthase SpsE